MSNYIVISRPEHLVSVKKRLKDADKVDVVSEADLLQYQDTLLSRPPDVLLMHSGFATTSRGATLIAAIKANARDTGTAIRVLIEDDVTPLLISEASLSPYDALLETSRPLDRAGTRQAARYPMNRRAVAPRGSPRLLAGTPHAGRPRRRRTRCAHPRGERASRAMRPRRVPCCAAG
jgi:hypothetical protein